MTPVDGLSASPGANVPAVIVQTIGVLAQFVARIVSVYATCEVASGRCESSLPGGEAVNFTAHMVYVFWNTSPLAAVTFTVNV